MREHKLLWHLLTITAVLALLLVTAQANETESLPTEEGAAEPVAEELEEPDAGEGSDEDSQKEEIPGKPIVPAETLPEGVSECYELTYGSVTAWDELAKAFEAALQDQNVTLSYESSRETVLTVDRLTGLITPVAGGTAEVTVNVENEEQITAYTIEIVIGKGEQKISGRAKSYTVNYSGTSYDWSNVKTNGDGKLTFTSSNPEVATVDPETGLITQTGVGTTEIKVTAAETERYQAATWTSTVTIRKGTQKISGRAKSYTVNYSGTSYDWSNVKTNGDGKLTFTSSNPEVATVDPKTGLVTQTGVGTTEIIVTAAETERYQAATLTSTLTIKKGNQSIKGIHSSYVVGYQKGKTYDWGKILKRTGDGTVTYQSSNPNVATVNQKTGKIVQVGKGTTVITITVSGTERYNKLVFKSTIKIKEKQTISGLKSSYKVTYQKNKSYDWGKQVKINGNGEVTYTSSNSNVVAVDAKTGKLVLKSAGTAVITIKASETTQYAAASLQSTVTVQKAAQKITGISSVYRLNYNKGHTYDWSSKRSTGGVPLTFTSDNPNVVSVDAKTGVLKLTGKGMATITATAPANNCYNKATFTSVFYVGQKTAELTGVKSAYTVSCKVGKTYDWKKYVKYTGDGTLTYTSSDPSVISVGKETGILTVKGPGTATITISASETAGYRAVSLSSIVTVQPNVTQYNFSDSYQNSGYYDKLMQTGLDSNRRLNIVRVAKSQVGYHEGKSLNNLSGNASGEGNYTEFGRWYYNYVDSSDYFYRGAWCSMFVSWCANEAGIPSSVVPRRALVEYMDDAFRNQGNYYKLSQTRLGGGSKTIQAGDLVFYSSSSSGRLSHIGIVTGVSYSGKKVTVTTVEGNYNDECRTRSWTLTIGSGGWISSGDYVRGFACPDY